MPKVMGTSLMSNRIFTSFQGDFPIDEYWWRETATVEKSGRCHLSQEIKNITSNGTNRHCVPPDSMHWEYHFWDFPAKSHFTWIDHEETSTNQIRNLQNNWPINIKNVNIIKSRRNTETALAFNFQKTMETKRWHDNCMQCMIWELILL